MGAINIGNGLKNYPHREDGTKYEKNKAHIKLVASKEEKTFGTRERKLERRRPKGDSAPSSFGNAECRFHCLFSAQQKKRDICFVEIHRKTSFLESETLVCYPQPFNL